PRGARGSRAVHGAAIIPAEAACAGVLRAGPALASPPGRADAGPGAGIGRGAPGRRHPSPAAFPDGERAPESGHGARHSVDITRYMSQNRAHWSSKLNTRPPAGPVM